MPYFPNIENARINARRFSSIDLAYNDWTPAIKSLVKNAKDDDWGTFIAAEVLLSTSIPGGMLKTVEEMIDREEREKQARRERAIGLLRARGACCVAAVCGLVALMAVLVVVGILTDVFFFEERYFAFGVVAMLGLAVLLGNTVWQWERGGTGLALLLSFVLALPAAVLCSVVPPLALLSVWCAWRTSDLVFPVLGIKFPGRSDYVASRKIEDLLQKTPQRFHECLSLAVKYSEEKGWIGLVALRCLDFDDEDYGTLIACEALLRDWQKWHPDEAEPDLGVDDVDRLRYGPEKLLGLRQISAFAGCVCAAIVGGLLLPPVWNWNLCWSVVVLAGLLAGFLAGNRVRKIYGLKRGRKQAVAILRALWFSAWIGMVCSYVVAITAA